MANKRVPKKPTGERGFLQIGSGTAIYQQQPWPPNKPSIEQEILDGALRIAARGTNLYDLTGPPAQNGENDFDFAIATGRGREDLDLMEVVLRVDRGGYASLPTSYSLDEMVAANVAQILEKSRHYGRTSRPLHLLLYSTDFRLELRSEVIDELAAVVAREDHVFATITYASVWDEGGGALETIFPRSGSFRSGNGFNTFVLFGDMRHAAIQPDGSVNIPVGMPGLNAQHPPKHPRVGGWITRCLAWMRRGRL